jgi:2-polyprenyl-6-methoxyphenol hydroxylase-like FAD-dependent oxidoreductase
MWSNGRVILVGDAAHPVGAGQGAAMAIEDGITLAHRLSREAAIADALVSYETARRPRIDRMLKISDDNRDAKQAGRLRRAIERFAMPIFFRNFYDGVTSWLYSEPLPSLDAPRTAAGRATGRGIRCRTGRAAIMKGS